ncbi:hypothetical protein [Allohahella sp. A8]
MSLLSSRSVNTIIWAATILLAILVLVILAEVITPFCARKSCDGG